MEKEKIANYMLKELKKRKCDEVVVNAISEKRTQIKFVNNGITAVTDWNLASLSIFLSYKKRTVSTSLDSLDKKHADYAVEKLLKMAKSTPENKEFYGIAKGPFSYKKIGQCYDKRIENLGGKGVDIAEEGINIALKNGGKRVSGVFEYDSAENYLCTSENVEARENGTSAYFSIRSFTDKDASGHKTACSRMLNKLDYVCAAKKAGQFSADGKNPEEISGGKYDVIFEPMAFSVILDNIAEATSIFSVEAGLSFFAGKLNKKIANENVTIIDDGTLENGYNSAMFDDEGVPTRKNVVIENGILKTYLHNSSTAKKYRTKTTANAGIISPEPWNTLLLPEKTNDESLFKSVDKGLYITNVWYTRYQNHATGDFSTIPRDSIFFIEKGKIKKAIRNIRISDNMINILKSIDKISGNSEQVIGWEAEKPVSTPHVLVKNVNITKSI